MAISIAILLALLALAFVLYPLFRPTDDIQPSVEGSEQDGAALSTSDNVTKPDILEREQTARVALQEVELDYQLGNIAEPEYRQLRERYMRRALVALKARFEREQELDDEIEDQLHKLKESHE